MPITSYPLCLDNGILSKFFGGGLADFQLASIKVLGFINFSIVNIVSYFNWLSPVVNLLQVVSDSIVGTLGVIGVPAMATAVGLIMWVTHYLKGTTHRIAYHIGIALLLMMIGIFLPAPIKFAAQAVGLGGAGATEIGQRATGTTQSATISQILATKFMREPLFRANFGANLDDIRMPNNTTCGDVFDAAVLNGDSPDDIRDTIGKQCPGGKTLVNYAKNPINLNFELMIANLTLFMLFCFVGFISVRVVMSGVATVWHAAALKPSLMFVMAGPAAQAFALRNALAIPLGGLAVFGDLLLLVLTACFTGVIAVAVGSSIIASIITTLSMIGLILGTWQFSRNLRGHGARLAEQATGASGARAANLQQARQSIRRVVTQGASLSAALAGNPAAAAAASQLGPGVLGGPRTTSLMHRRGQHNPGALAQPPTHNPALPGGAGPRAALAPSPVAAASKIAYTTRQVTTTRWNSAKPGAVNREIKYETTARAVQPRQPGQKALPSAPAQNQAVTQPSPAAARRRENAPRPGAHTPPEQAQHATRAPSLPNLSEDSTQRATSAADQNRNRRNKP
ncbi:hypothetical protein [Mycobacteroides salmoniphilum]|uniref:hypothetical protein n=1 Tax=Mycobacteroides salmoniphilum TaxID=404941 RepID=UPI001292BDFC|nr:hypothetical protein [Mycobacteroides salmoniphilum]